MLNKQNDHGLTLIEILISIVLIALIGIVFFPNLRGFNNTQTYQNEVLNIKNDIKKAQTMFATGTRCSASKASTAWSLVFSTTSTSITSNLQATCINASFVSNTEALAATTTTSTTLQSSTCTAGTTAIELKFDRTGFSYKCGTNPFATGAFNLQLQNKNNTSQSSTITISSGGIISQN